MDVDRGVTDFVTRATPLGFSEKHGDSQARNSIPGLDGRLTLRCVLPSLPKSDSNRHELTGATLAAIATVATQQQHLEQSPHRVAQVKIICGGVPLIQVCIGAE